MTNNGFESSYNIDQMLYNDMVWLSKRIHLPVKEFEVVAKQMELTQENWARFWRVINYCKSQESNIHVLINDHEGTFTQEV